MTEIDGINGPSIFFGEENNLSVHMVYVVIVAYLYRVAIF